MNIYEVRTQAINAYYAQIIQVRGILKLPYKVTLAAMKELDSDKVRTYDTMNDLRNDLDNDE